MVFCMAVGVEVESSHLEAKKEIAGAQYMTRSFKSSNEISKLNPSDVISPENPHILNILNGIITSGKVFKCQILLGTFHSNNPILQPVYHNFMTISKCKVGIVLFQYPS